MPVGGVVTCQTWSRGCCAGGGVARSEVELIVGARIGRAKVQQHPRRRGASRFKVERVEAKRRWVCGRPRRWRAGQIGGGVGASGFADGIGRRRRQEHPLVQWAGEVEWHLVERGVACARCARVVARQEKWKRDRPPPCLSLCACPRARAVIDSLHIFPPSTLSALASLSLST